MTATVIPLPPCRVPRRLGPVPVVIAGGQVLGGVTGPLLELRVVLRLVEVPPAQRRRLVALVRGGQPLVPTLGEAPTGEGKG